MQISNNKPMEILWEGNLESTSSDQTRTLTNVHARLGRPHQWPEGQLFDKDWQRPTGNKRYYLTRFVFSLEPDKRTEIINANFCLTVESEQPEKAIIFDAFPREQLQPQSLPLTLTLGPTLKFDVPQMSAEASLASGTTTIDFGRAIPIVHTSGLSQSNFCWRYTAHRQHPLIGDRQMYAILELPIQNPTVIITIDLAVKVATRYGPLLLTTPPNERYRINWVVGEIDS